MLLVLPTSLAKSSAEGGENEPAKRRETARAAKGKVMAKPTVEQATENVLFYVEHFMKTGRLKDAGFTQLEQAMKFLLELKEEEENV